MAYIFLFIYVWVGTLSKLLGGFDVQRIMNAYEKETVQEYEECKEEFLKWKESKGV